MDFELLPQPCTLAALVDKLAEGFHVLHLVCHGSFADELGVAALYLADGNDQAARVHDEEIVTALRYPWGSEDYQSGFANINETSLKVGPHYLQKTSAVGMYSQGVSPYGVADLSGNVWEWCLNEYDSGKTDPGGSANRVLRGGSWNDAHVIAAAPARFRLGSVSRNYFCGFRVVVVGCVPVPKL